MVGIEDDTGHGTPVAIVRDQIANAAVMELTIGDTDLIAWHRPGQACSLDDSRVSGGRDIGTVGVFIPEVGGLLPAGLHAIRAHFGLRHADLLWRRTNLQRRPFGRVVDQQHFGLAAASS